MKKALITALAIVGVACVSGGILANQVDVGAESTNQITFSETKLNVSTDGDKMLVVTAINDAENVSYVSEIGYTIDGYEVNADDFAPVDKYYETITLGVDGTPKTAQDLGFAGADENSKLLIWEIAYDPAIAYEITAYAIHEGNADKTVVGTEKKNTITVTFEVEGVTVEPRTVNYGAAVAAPAVGGYDVSWTLNGEAYDFSTPVTKNITLAGTKTLKQVKVSADSYLTPGDVAIVFDDDGTIGFPSMSVNGDSYLYLGFDLTSADIEVLQSLGYTHLTFACSYYVSGNTSKTTNFFGTAVPANYKATSIMVSLDNLSDCIDGNLKKISLGYNYYQQMIWFENFELMKVSNVTEVKVSADSYLTPGDVAIVFDDDGTIGFPSMDISTNSYLYLGFDMTSADVEVLKSLGYTHLTFTCSYYVSGNTGKTTDFFGTAVPASYTPTTIMVSLDDLDDCIDGNLKKISLGYNYYKQMIWFGDFEFVKGE